MLNAIYSLVLTIAFGPPRLIAMNYISVDLLFYSKRWSCLSIYSNRTILGHRNRILEFFTKFYCLVIMVKKRTIDRHTTTDILPAIEKRTYAIQTRATNFKIISNNVNQVSRIPHDWIFLSMKTIRRTIFSLSTCCEWKPKNQNRFVVSGFFFATFFISFLFFTLWTEWMNHFETEKPKTDNQ